MAEQTTSWATTLQPGKSPECGIGLPACLTGFSEERFKELLRLFPGLIRLPRVVALTGYGKSTIWERARAGTFPAPVRLGANATAWREAEVIAWIEALPRAVA